jgi:hypothetical protein
MPVRTWPKRASYPTVPSNSYISLIERNNGLMGTSQTFPAGAPLSFSSGLLVVFVNPTTAKIAAWASEAATGVINNRLKYILATPEVEIEANLLGSSAANYVLLATDLGTALDLAANANLEGTGLPGWYIQKTTSDPAVTVCEFFSDDVVPNTAAPTFPAAGDTNARVRARITPGKGIFT